MNEKQIKKCSVEGCDKKYYAKGYCHSHYYSRVFIDCGALYKCKIEGCNNSIHSKSIYCSQHKRRIDNKLSTDLTIDLRTINMVGNKNHRWNGGNSQYKNHSKMKRNRKIRFEQVDYICEKCGNDQVAKIYHKDRDNTNHEIDNLMAVCQGCFWDIHMEARRLGIKLKMR